MDNYPVRDMVEIDSGINDGERVAYHDHCPMKSADTQDIL